MTSLRHVRVFEVVRPHRRRYQRWHVAALVVGAVAFAALLSLSLLHVVLA